jgi:predicted DNA-binding ribbon-helix-helix protein
VKSSVLQRSIVIAAHKTSVSLEDAFWKEIAAERGMILQELVAAIDRNREHPNPSSAIRRHRRDGSVRGADNLVPASVRSADVRSADPAA